MKNVFKTVALITIFTALTRLSGFIFRIYLSREIGAEALGMYQIAFSVFVVLVTICCSGIPITVSRLNAKYIALNKKQDRYSATTSAFIIAGLTAVFLCITILVFRSLLSSLFTDKNCMLILLTLLPAVAFSAIHGVIRGYLWGENDYLSVCVIELIEQYVRIIACVIALNFAYTTLQGALSASWSITIAIFISCACIIYVYIKKGGKLHFKKEHFKQVLSSSTPITALRFISSLLQPLIAIIVPFCLVNTGYTSEQSLALFGIAMGMAFPLLFLPTTIIDSLSITLISSLTHAKAKNNTSEVQSQISTSFTFATFVACLCMPIFLSLGEPICVFLFNSSLAGDFLSKASLAIIPFSLSGITTSMLNSLEYEKQTFLYFLLSSIVMIILLFVLPYYIGIDAISVAFFLQSAIICYFNLRLLTKQKYIVKSNYIILIKLMLLSFATAIFTYSIFNIFYLFAPLFVTLLFTITLAIIFFCIFCQICNFYNVKLLLQKLLKKSKKQPQKAHFNA